MNRGRSISACPDNFPGTAKNHIVDAGNIVSTSSFPQSQLVAAVLAVAILASAYGLFLGTCTLMISVGWSA